ncbi:hypothetical protein [Collimonas silvisoli]|uniref:hypothetical protein n=1 Tax=Collimonas silvisoli TaxID=2825884 RepID=UPI001B8D89C8|nr:hypothetical protein [Collimonas silvisoli]
MNAIKKQVEEAKRRLDNAIADKRTLATCLRRWSLLVRLRDGNRCVVCHQTHKLSAHHICRKSFLPEARLQSGNGITLCGECHDKFHEGFNRRADLSQPMDAQGGEKIEILCWLFEVLARDGEKRNLICDDFYYLSDSVLSKFKMFQGFDPFIAFPGYRLQQAYLIWRQCPLQLRNAILEANGFSPSRKPLIPGITIRY